MKQYVIRVFHAFSRLLNALTGGSDKEVLSRRMGRTQCFLCRPVCWLLDKIDPDHCNKASS